MNRLFLFVLFLALLLVVMRSQAENFANEGAITGGVIGGIVLLLAVFGYFTYRDVKKALSFAL